MKFHTTFYVLTALVAIALAATVAEIEGDIQRIDADVQKLDTDVNNFPDIAAALTIHDDAVNLGEAIDKGTSDVKNVGPISGSDARNILKDVDDVKPTILSALKDIVAKKPAFDGDGLSDVVLQDLKNLNSSASGFGAALIKAAPADLQAQATPIKSTIDAAFTTAIATYS